MKMLMRIGEVICGVILWVPVFVAMPIGLIMTARQLPRYLRARKM